MLEFASHGLFGSEVGNQTKKTGGSLVSRGGLVAGLTQVCMQEAGVQSPHGGKTPSLQMFEHCAQSTQQPGSESDV